MSDMIEVNSVALGIICGLGIGCAGTTVVLACAIRRLLKAVAAA